MSERKSPATNLAHAVVCAAAAGLFVSRAVSAQTSPQGTAQSAPTPRTPVDAIARPEPRVRRLSSGLTVVSARVPENAAAVVLTIPAGTARGESASALSEVLARQSTIESARCERAGIVSTSSRDRGWADFVSRAPASALELALWREATRLDVLDASASAAIRAAHHAAFDPSHAVLVVIAPVDDAALDAVIERTVARIPSRRTARAPLRAEPEPMISWLRGEDGGWSRQWPVVGDRAPDHYAIELISWALAEGRRSLLPAFLSSRSVRGAVIVDAFVDHEPERDRFHLELRYAAPQNNRPALDVLADDFIVRLAREGITGAELTRARERWRVEWRAGEGSIDRLALRWARFESRFGNARLALTEEDRFDAVTVQDVLRVFNEQLIRITRNTAPEVSR